MKILVVGDLHFKYELSYASCIKDGRRSEWEAVKEEIHSTSKDCDAVVLLGDNFNARHNHSSVIKEFVNFLNGFGNKEIHILAGNHERYGDSTAIDFLKNIKPSNWFIYTEPKLTTVAGQPAMMIPFMTPALLGVNSKEDGVQALLKMLPNSALPLAFCHQGISGSRLNNIVVDFFNEIVLSKEELEKHFWHIFGGHIHGKQMLFPSTYITGNIFSNEVGDHSKSIWTYKSDGTMNVEVTEIPLPVRGIYKIVWEGANINSIPLHSIVKCYITDRETNLDLVRNTLKSFDASIIIEQYPSEREKIHFEDGVLDLSVETMLKHYAEAKRLSYEDLKEGFELIRK